MSERPRHLPIVGSLLLFATTAAGLSVYWHLAPRWQIAERLGTAGDPDATTLAGLLRSASEESRRRSFATILETRDRRFIPPLVDLLRFVQSGEVHDAAVRALGALTGEAIAAADPAKAMIAWLGLHPEIEPPPGYVAWKGELLGQVVDPHFREFLHRGVATRLRVEEIVWGGTKIDAIVPLNDPRVVKATEEERLRDDEPVFGIAIGGEARAYPLRILDWHEVVNDVVGGRPVLLSYCTLSAAGILYDAEVDGERRAFGTSGLLFRSNKLMFDRGTKTLWSQMTGEAVVGPLAGRGLRLARLPMVIARWGDWRTRHPETTVLSRETGHRRPYELGVPYGPYFASPEPVFAVGQKSDRLPAKERVFAVELGGRAKAFPLPELRAGEGVVNDVLGEAALVVVHDGAAGDVTLPPRWIDHLRGASGSQAIGTAHLLDVETARRALAADPSLAHALSADVLLAMPVATRLALLAEQTPPELQGGEADGRGFAPNLRNEVAVRGLAGEVRAFRRGEHRFTRGATTAELVDEKDAIWTVGEDALTSAAGERLERVPGHVGYWFGWFAFFPETEVYPTRHSP